MRNDLDPEMKQLVTKKILIYLGITFGLTYIFEIGGLYPLFKELQVTQDNDVALRFQSLLSSVMFFPALGVVLTRLITKEGFRGGNLFLGLNLKKHIKFYLLSWFGIMALILVGAGLYFLIFPKQFDPEFTNIFLMYEAMGESVTREQVVQLVITQLLMGVVFSPFLNFITCFGEEWGWRGYLLPLMLKRFKMAPTLLITGVIWGLWHAPLTVMGHNYGLDYPGFPFLGIFAMCLFCIVNGTIFSYLCIKTNSCIPAIFAHGSLNGFASISALFLIPNSGANVFIGPMPVGIIGGFGLIACAAVCFVLLQKEEKKRLETANES